VLTVRQTRNDYPGAALLEQTHGWVAIRTDTTFDGKIGIMSEPFTTSDFALSVVLLSAPDLATVAYAKILRS
jgi:hypothetical protein